MSQFELTPLIDYRPVRTAVKRPFAAGRANAARLLERRLADVEDVGANPGAIRVCTWTPHDG